MIILFEENEKSFSTLGLGVLKDATSCVVKEKLNDEFTLTMEYPVKGSNFGKIKNNRIICVKPNPYDEPQAFRIYNVTKAINGKVIVDANHISYDTNSIPVKAFSAKSLQDALVQIQNGCIVDNPFELSSDISRSKTYKTTAPYNLRAILMSDEQSIVTEYDAELEFDNYLIKILSKRGKNRGAVVRYGHNMVDINHSLSTDLLYNGVFPYYHTEKTTTETKTSDEFQQVYIVGSKPYQDGWLSYSKDGEPYHPLDESPVQIATEGEYYQKVFVWNTLYSIYQEKIYNEQVTIIQGLTEPSWLTIDWSRFPLIVIKAAYKGYYKKATDTDWGEIKGVGDVIYEGSITSSGLMENLIINFSEVIPSKNSSTNEEVSEIVDVQLDQPIMWIETNDAKTMLHDRILMLDLTSEFEEEPSQLNLRTKAEEYINKHKIGTIKHSTTLSFVDLSSTNEASRFENIDHIELGDTVKIIYEDANIEVELRVITTEYDVLSGRYNSVELGEKKDKMSSSTIQNGDNVSALTNDVGYATVTTVNKLIANIVTANYIEALNAKLSSAQISQLSVERINCTGIIEASQFTIDSLVAKLLVADNAEISDTLTAGNIKVAGDIAINSGQITIKSDKGTQFIVDRDGNLTANSVNITGGNLNINDGVFEVTNDGVLTATAADISGTIRAKEGEIANFVISERQLHYGDIGTLGSVVMSTGTTAIIPNLINERKTWAFVANNKFGVTVEGILYAKDAILSGKIEATSGYIGGFEIKNDRLESGSIIISPSQLKYGSAFTVSSSGSLIASDVNITGGSISVKDSSQNENFKVTSSGILTAKGATIDGKVDITSGSISIKNTLGVENFKVDSNGILTAKGATIDGKVDITSGSISIKDTLGTENFKVTSSGILTAKGATIDGKVDITSGSISIKDSSQNENFKVTSSGILTAKGATIDGSITATSGTIGGFDIADSKLYSDSIEISPDKLKYGTNFEVNASGVLTASNVNITGGSITNQGSSSGVSTTIINGILTANGADISGNVNITSGSISIKDSSQNENFKVTSDGFLTATGASIDGTITATNGSVGGLTIGTNYVGFYDSSNPEAGSLYLRTDGRANITNLYIKNSIDFADDSKTYTVHGTTTAVRGYFNSSGLYVYKGPVSGGGQVSRTIRFANLVGLAPVRVKLGPSGSSVQDASHTSGASFMCIEHEISSSDDNGYVIYTYDASWFFDEILGVWATLKKTTESASSGSGTFTHENQAVTADWHGTTITVEWNNHSPETKRGVSILVLGRPKSGV